MTTDKSVTNIFLIIMLLASSLVAEGKALAGERDIKGLIESDWVAIQSQYVFDPGNPQSIGWEYKITPGFPAAWPPQGNVALVYYGYPYGFSSNLRDGEHIGKPWVRVEVAPDKEPVKKVLLRKIFKIGTQGIRPLDSREVHIAENGLLAQDYLGKLTGLPAEQNPKTVMMRDYYCLWLRTNSVVGGLLRKQHADFIAWLPCGVE
jgi:hypothetical protein